MAESTTIDVRQTVPGERRNWLVTGRPFKIDQSAISPYMLGLYESNDIPHTYELGFSDKELAEWKGKKYPILEIGPGTGASSQELLDEGINLFVLEPSLRYPADAASNPSIEEAIKRFSSSEFQGRVSAANAADASLAFPDRKFHAAFAIGVNFQNYAPSESALVNQIGGVLAALEDTADSYFAFQIPENGWLNLSSKGPLMGEGLFNLRQFLDDKNIRYSPPQEFVGKNGLRTVIRIYKQSTQGENQTQKFDSVPADLSKYYKNNP